MTDEMTDEPTAQRLSLIGRDRVLANKLLKELHSKTYHPTLKPWETRRGGQYDVQLVLKEGKREVPTGHVFRVTVELIEVDPFGGRSPIA